MKRVQAITIHTRETQKRLFDLFSAHALDWILPETFDFSHDGHELMLLVLQGCCANEDCRP